MTWRARWSFIVPLLALLTPQAAAISFDSVGSASGALTTVTLTTPASAAQNDLLLAAIAVRGGTATSISAPAGWTSVTRADSTTIQSVAIYQRIAPASPGGTAYAFTVTAGTDTSAALLVYRGVDTSAPINIVGSPQTATNSASATALAVTTTRANSMLVGFYLSAKATTGPTAPSGMTARYHQASGGGGSAVTMDIFDVAQASAGSSGNKVAAIDKSDNMGLLVALSAPTVSFVGSSSSGAESTTSVTLTVQLNAASSAATTVQYAVTGGTATATSDFTLGGTGTLSVAAGSTSGTISLTIVDDAAGELDETIVIGLSNPSGAAVVSPSTYTYTITDNDPRIAVAANPVSATGVAQTGIAWGGWAADPGATGVAGLNYLKVTNVGTIAAQQFTIDFSSTTFVGVTDAAQTITLDGNVRFASFQDTTPGTSAPNEGTYTFGSTSASGSVTLTFSATGNIFYVVYSVDTLPSILTDQAYQASYTVSAV